MKRLRHCRLHATGEVVGVYRSLDGAYVTGVQTCKSVWACPVCSAVIRTRRALVIEAAASAWAAQEGHWLGFLTLTVRHGQWERLNGLYGGLAGAWRYLRQLTWWRELGWVGFWRSVEVTYGENGWHPHMHLLLFGEGPADLRAIGRELGPRWRDAVMRSGLRATTLRSGSRLQAVTVGGANLGEYLSKVLDGEGQSWDVGSELARSDVKRGGAGRSPMELLATAADGERWAAERWWEYEQATFGRRAIEASRGLTARLGIDDQADEDLALEDEGGEAVLTLHRSDYTALASRGFVPSVLDAVEGDPIEAVDFVQALLRLIRE